jgi:hypothetical protein
MLPLVSVVFMASALLLKVPMAQSSDTYQGSFVSNSLEASDEIIDRQILEEGQVLLVQTKSHGVEPMAEAYVVTITRSYLVTVEGRNGEVIRVYQGLGEGAELLAIATMSESEATQLLRSNGRIIEPFKP